MVIRQVALVTLIGVILAAACAPVTSPYMLPLSGPEPAGCPPDQARLVFVRPASYPAKVVFLIIDGQGRFVGESTALSRFSVLLDPGEHYFIAWVGSPETLKATVAAGRTYYVEVRPKFGGAALWAVNRKSGLMQWIPSYLTGTTAFTPDVAAGQESLIGADVPRAVRQGLRAYAKYSPKDKADATLMPEDGL